MVSNEADLEAKGGPGAVPIFQISFADQRPFAPRAAPTATNTGKPVLRLWLTQNFLVVFKGYSRWAVECRSGGLAGNGSLTPDILQSCCLKGFWFSFVSYCKETQIKSTRFS